MKKDIVTDFKKMWSNSRTWLKKPTLSICDKVQNGDAKGVSCCVYSAYQDACRTFRFDKKLTLTQIHDNRNYALNNLYNKMLKYLKSDNPNCFNHKKWSDELIKDFSSCTNMNYGKAQKIINMSFKYFYCCDDRPKEKMFYPCHMALDQFTLEWYKEISHVYFDGWSSIEKYELYMAIQNHIRIFLSKQTKYSKYPILAEFDIWDSYRSSFEYFLINSETSDKQYNDKIIYINSIAK